MNSETLPSSEHPASGGEYRMSPWLPWIIRLSAVGTALFFGLLGWVGLLVLMVAWIPARRHAR